MTHDLDTYVNPAARKTSRVTNHMVSLPLPVYTDLTALAKDLKISRGAAIEALLNYFTENEVTP